MNEDTLISLAIAPSSRHRYREMQGGNAKKRYKILDKLNHNPSLDERYAKWYSSFDKAVRNVSIVPNTEVYILSASEEIDGKYMPIEKAIEEVPLCEWGTLIGVSPNLALYYGESGERAAVIHKLAKP